MRCFLECPRKPIARGDADGGVVVSNATVVFELENATEVTGEIAMDDSTKTGSTVVQLYTLNEVGQNSPPPLKGTLLTIVDGR